MSDDRADSTTTAATGDGDTVAALQAQLADREAILRQVESAHALAVERLRTALAASEPAIDPTLITGDSVDAVEASYTAAREMIERMRAAVSREAATAIPAGASGRQVAQPATAFEKIRSGLSRLP